MFMTDIDLYIFVVVNTKSHPLTTKNKKIWTAYNIPYLN